MKSLFALLLLVAFAFADSSSPPGWMGYVSISGIALLASAMLLIAIYLAGIAANSNEMKFLAHEEFYQWIITALMVGAFLGAVSFSNSLSNGVAESLGFPGESTLFIANEIVKNDTVMLSQINMNIVSLANKIGTEASRSAFCSLQGVGIALAGCGGFRMLSTPLTLSSNAVAAGFAELSVMSLLLSIGGTTAVSVLLPAGIFLRIFKFTRAAGGFLIALGVTLHLVLPLAIVFTNVVIEKFVDTNPEYSWNDKIPDVKSCNPWNVLEKDLSVSLDFGGGDTTGNNIDTEIDLFKKLVKLIDNYIFQILIKITMKMVISILVMVTAVKYLSSLAGAEIDIMAMAKIA